MAAVKRATPGDVIHVYPAIYREGIAFDKGGTAERPIRLEGVRGKDGHPRVVDQKAHQRQIAQHRNQTI